MELVTFGPVKNSELEIKTAIKNSLQKLKSQPKLAIIYPSISIDIKKIISFIKAESDVPVIGATTGGAAFTELGITHNGLVGGFIGGDTLSVQVVSVKNIAADPSGNIAKAIAAITPAKTPGHSLFVLADAMAYDGEAMIKEILAHAPIHWRLFGGFAGDNWQFTGTKVIHDNDVFQGGAVYTYINDGKIPSISVRHGFTEAAGSNEMVITSGEGNIVHTIDNEPAAQVYRNELIRLGLITEADDYLQYFATYPIGIRTILGEKLKIRTPMSLQGDSLVLAGSFNKDAKIHIMIGETENMLAAVTEMKNEAVKGLNGVTPSVQLVIDCAGRQRLLGDRYREQVKNFRISATCPMLGFTSYGEIARYGGTLEGFHNTTAVTAVW